MKLNDPKKPKKKNAEQNEIQIKSKQNPNVRNEPVKPQI